MYVVRRHSRRLFFPAGLLALAWLLCLGCALLAARPELRPGYRVMPLSLPPLQRHFSEFAGKRINFSPEEMYASPAQLDTMHSWRTVRITDNCWENELSARMATFVAGQLKTDPNHDRGLRIEFERSSRYQSLVAMLNMFNTVGLEKYWLDVRHEPVSLNTFTEIPKPQPTTRPDSIPLTWICGGVMLEQELPPVPLHIDASALFETASWQPLLASYWRYPALLLLLLPLAAAWQLRRLTLPNTDRR